MGNVQRLALRIGKAFVDSHQRFPHDARSTLPLYNTSNAFHKACDVARQAPSFGYCAAEEPNSLPRRTDLVGLQLQFDRISRALLTVALNRAMKHFLSRPAENLADAKPSDSS